MTENVSANATIGENQLETRYSEKPESLATAAAALHSRILAARFLREFWDVRQRQPFERRPGICNQQRLSDALAVRLGHMVERFPQLQRAGSRIVRVARHKMHGSLTQPFFRCFLSCSPKSAEQRLSGDLRVTTLPQPPKKPLGLRPDQRIALRMRDDGADPGELQLMQRLIERRRNREIGKFDQQVVLLIQSEPFRVVLYFLKIVEAQVEITPGGQGQPPLEASLNFIPALLYQFGNKRVVRIRMWCANYVGNSIGNRGFSHGAGHLERLGAIIKIRKYVAMNINHLRAG